MIKTEIIPVIHMINQNQVLTNVKTCVESGVNKVFIINHQSPSNELIKCASYIKEAIDATVIPTTSGAGTGKEDIFTIFIS